MRFLCVQCDEHFESEVERPRCPKCMRIHGIHRLTGVTGAGGPKLQPGLWIAVAVLATALLAGAVYFLLEQPGAEPGGDQDPAAELEKLGVEGTLAGLLQADDAIARFAQRVTEGAGDDRTRAEAVVQALRARAEKQAFVPWSMADPREGEPRVAAEVWDALQADGARERLYPLELSALAVAALRAVEVPAQVAEIRAYDGQQAPLDPSGCIGYFGVAVPLSGGGVRVFDPYAGRTQQPPEGMVTVLDDRQAVAAALGLDALHETVWEADPGAALKSVEAGLSLWPNSANLRSARAVALAASGGVQEGERALEAAVQMREDAPRLNNLATYRLQRGDLKAATKYVTRALELSPDFAAARVVLAGVQMASGEPELARAELVRAEGLDPELPTLPLAWAQYYATKGDFEEAVRRAEQGAKLRPKQPHLQLNLGRLRRAAGDYAGMRRAAARALELTPSDRRAEMREMIAAVLGPTALEAAEAADAGVAAEVDPAPSAVDLPTQVDDTFRVSRGSKLLGDQTDKPAAGDLHLGKSPPKLGLGGSDLDVDLDVDLDP